MPKKKVIANKNKKKISKKKTVLEKKTKSPNIAKKSKAKTNPLELIFKENETQLISLITKEFDKELLKTMRIIPINEAKSILEYSLMKSVNPLNINESDILQSQKSSQIENNLKENLTH